MMMRVVLLLIVIVAAAAFRPLGRASSSTKVSMGMDMKKVAAAAVIGASTMFGGINQVRAEVDYDGIKYLGGGDKVDLNNANIRAYLKFPGMYPTVAGKVVSNGPFKNVGDVYNIPGLTGPEKDVLKKYEGKFVALDVKPEYEIDKINNGLYR